MEINLHDELREGEKLLWSAPPETFETLDVTHKQHFIKNVIMACGIALAIAVIYIVFAINKGIDVKLGLVAILLAGAVIASANSLLDGKKLRKVTYVITDQRLMCADYKVRSVDYASIKEAQLKTDADGHVSLLCGKKALKSKPQHWRMFTLSGAHIDEETGICESFAFYALPDAESVKKILIDYLPL